MRTKLREIKDALIIAFEEACAENKSQETIDKLDAAIKKCDDLLETTDTLFVILSVSVFVWLMFIVFHSTGLI